MPHFYQPGQCRVLAVDDEAGVRRVYKRCLSSLFDVNTADSIATARELLGSGAEFDALILDLGMAGEDTHAFWGWLRQTYPTLADATLIITGDPDVPAYSDIVLARDGWVVTKPVTPWDLRDRLWSLLGEAESC